MHDLSFFRNNLDAVAARLATRGMTLDLDGFRDLDARRRAASRAGLLPRPAARAKGIRGGAYQATGPRT
jgi:hypothetical protein